MFSFAPGPAASAAAATQPSDTEPAYAELHCLSNFSFLRGASHPEELVEQAAALGYSALAITDCNSLAGVVRAHLAAREHNLPLIIGSRITPTDAPPLVLLAPDRAAYGRLARLITRGRLRRPKGDCEIRLADVAEFSAGLIALALPPPTLDPALPRSLDPCFRYAEIFPRRLYLAAELTCELPDAVQLARLAALAQATAIPLVAAGDVHYHVPQRRYLQDVLTCIRAQCTLVQAGRRLFANAERHLRPRDELARRYAGYESALARTVEIAQRCTFTLDELRYEYPHELCPPGQSAMQYLSDLTWAGARERYPAGVPAAVRGEVEKELAIITELHYEHYFLTVWDIVRFARGRDILCQGRGSAANSAVCYCLGVTAVDPARIEVLFERFISRERNEPPDIDIDFEHERREEVFQYIYDKYSRERAGITAEVITYRPRSAVRDVGKALGLSLDRIDALAKALDWWHVDAIPAEAFQGAGLDPRDRTVQMLTRLVQQLLGFPRHLSQHVGGFVITETPLCEIVPLENGAMPNRTFIEWDKDDIDAVGLLKVDCLALGMLTALNKCFKLLRGEEGRRDAGTQGHRDTGTEGHRDAGTQGWNGEENSDEKDFSRSDRVAEGDRPGQTDLHRHVYDAARGALRSDRSNAPRGGVDCQQHRRGQCTPGALRLLAFPDNRPRLVERTRDTGDHRAGTRDVPPSHDDNGSDPGDRPHPARPDSKPETGAELNTPSAPASLRPCVPTSLSSIPPEDPLVYDLICAADTVGVFQIESRAQMSMLPRLRPRCFYDLVIEVAIVRPGPIQGGMVHPYLRRRNGEETVDYPSTAVRDVLAKTLGVPLFQEQVMRVAMVAAGFSAGEADRLRRAMAAWRRNGALDAFTHRLVTGMLANGYTPAFAQQIYTQIHGFGEYGFPESHSASFALLVYASAWLKRYHPAAFCAALLNAQPLGFYTPGQLVRDALAHGVPVRPVDVNFSGWDCRLEKTGIEGSREQGIKGAEEVT